VEAIELVVASRRVAPLPRRLPAVVRSARWVSLLRPLAYLDDQANIKAFGVSRRKMRVSWFQFVAPLRGGRWVPPGSKQRYRCPLALAKPISAESQQNPRILERLGAIQPLSARFAGGAAERTRDGLVGAELWDLTGPGCGRPPFPPRRCRSATAPASPRRPPALLASGCNPIRRAGPPRSPPFSPRLIASCLFFFSRPVIWPRTLAAPAKWRLFL
jgi:hypothetical protein